MRAIERPAFVRPTEDANVVYDPFVHFADPLVTIPLCRSWWQFISVQINRASLRDGTGIIAGHRVAFCQSHFRCWHFLPFHKNCRKRAQKSFLVARQRRLFWAVGSRWLCSWQRRRKRENLTGVFYPRPHQKNEKKNLFFILTAFMTQVTRAKKTSGNNWFYYHQLGIGMRPRVFPNHLFLLCFYWLLLPYLTNINI